MIALIITQGPAQAPRALRRLAAAADLILAADGGTRLARAAGVVPHVIVGDLDSLDGPLARWAAARRIPRRRYPRAKDATDGELAVDEALRRGAREIWTYGPVAGRLDQLLANVLLLFVARRRGASARVTDGRASAWLAPRAGEIHGRPGDLVSLIPLSPIARGITTGGLRYALRGGALRRGSTRGISNEMLAGRATVRVGSGDLLIVHTPAR